MSRSPQTSTKGKFIIGIPKSEFRRGRLSGTRFLVATVIRDKGPMTMAMVAREMGVPENVVSGRVTELRKMGYIRPTGKLVSHPWAMKRSVEWEFVDKPEPVEVPVYSDEDEKDLRDMLEHFKKRIRAVNQNRTIAFHAWEVSMLIDRVERRLQALGLKRGRGKFTQARATHVG